MSTLQDFRNEVQEMFFREMNYMNRSGETRSCNVLQQIINKLDYQYGTEYQKTASQFLEETPIATKQKKGQQSLF